MQTTLRSLSRTFQRYPATSLTPISAPTFCTWKPNVPRYRSIVKDKDYHMSHPTWDFKDVVNIEQTHRKPENIRDWVAYMVIKTLRTGFDLVSGYNPKTATEDDYLARFIFLEVIAGVPGMIGGMGRHMKSIVTMREDKGWIHHLLEEAENERMHLFVYLDVRHPGWIMRAGLMAGQAAFIVAYAILYFLSPRTAHRFVGYLEEEAIKTYTFCVDEIDQGQLLKWRDLPAPQSAIDYWSMEPDATFRDVIMVVRADEVMHREVNHRLGDLQSTDSMVVTTVNPDDVADGVAEQKEKDEEKNKDK